MTCNPSYFSPTVGCGAHGICTPDIVSGGFVCACEAGWTQFGEFSNLASNPCEIHLVTIQALNGAAIVGALIAALASLWGITSRYRSPREMSLKHWRIWGLPLTVGVLTCFHLPYSILRIVQPTTFVAGLSLPATVCWFIITFLFCQQMLLALSILTRVSEGVTHMRPGGAHSSPHSGARNRCCATRGDVLIWIVWLCGLVVCALPIVACYHPETIFIFVGIQGGTIGAMFVVFGVFVVRHTLNVIIEALSKTIEATAHMQHTKTSRDAQLRRILLKTRVARRVAAVGFPLFAAAILTFSVWPFLVTKGAYFVPLILLSAETTCVVIIWITTTTSTNDLQRRLSHWASPMRKRSSGTGAPQGDKRKSLLQETIPGLQLSPAASATPV